MSKVFIESSRMFSEVKSMIGGPLNPERLEEIRTRTHELLAITSEKIQNQITQMKAYNENCKNR